MVARATDFELEGLGLLWDLPTGPSSAALLVGTGSSGTSSGSVSVSESSAACGGREGRLGDSNTLREETA